MGKIYRPRMAAEITVPLFGTTAAKQQQIRDDGAITIPLRLRRAMLESNDHNHADTLELETDWRSAGIDPRQLSSARVRFFLGDADQSGRWYPSEANLRFVGILVNAGRSAGSGRGMSVGLKFLDYTSFFLNQKNFPPDGIPALTDTLSDAWRKICDNVGFFDVDARAIVSSVAELKDNLVFSAGVDPNTQIGAAVTERFRKLGKVTPKPGADAWAVWQQCCGMLGLITYFRLDKCIVTTATDYYTLDAPPVFVWQQNILEWSEETGSHRSHKGVGITSYNPLTNSVLESFYPPPGDPRVKVKRTKAASKKAPKPPAFQSDNYEMFAVPGVTDQGKLDGIAQRAFEEYSRQQCEGTITTREMRVSTVGAIDQGDGVRRVNEDGEQSDILKLGAGDAIRVKFDGDLLQALADKTSTEWRANYLVGRGYDPGTAQLMAENFDSLKGLSPTFHTKCVRTTLEISDTSGSFEVQMTYANLIDVFGSADK